MSNLNHYYLQQMGIQPWILRNNPLLKKQLMMLEQEVVNCQRCSLAQSRTRTVFARGNAEAKFMIIGEAPGFHEDQQGLPFVGKAGQLLNKMLFSIQFSEEDVYIANVLKCRPPSNRDPLVEEIQKCSDHLQQQIQLIQPKLILALGRFSAQFLTNSTATLSHMRNQIFYYKNIPVVVTYHPAYLLRNPKDKKNAFSDLLTAKRLIQTQ